MQDGLGSTSWVYDNLNRVTFITDPFNKTVGYTYDAESKRSSITYPVPVSKTISYQYNSLDQLKTVLDGTTQLAEYDYDTAGRLSDVSLANGLNSVLDYSLSGQLTNLSHHQNGIQLVDYVYRYNALGLRDQVHETLFDPYITLLPLVLKGEAQELLQGMGDGQLESSETGYPPPLPEAPEETVAPQSEGMETYPPPPEDEDQTSFLRQAWDFLVELFSVSKTVSASYNLQSGYPPPPEPDDPPLPDEQVIDYVYDPLGRLVEASYSNGPDYVYEYDKVGNRTTQIVDSATTVYQYDAADRLTSAGGTAFTWDDNGNLLGDGVNSYAYDAANRLLTASGQGLSYGFGYDGFGNRYRQTVGGQTSNYTLDLAGSLSQVLYDGEFSYYYGLGRISQQQGSISEYFLNDALGSVRQIANSNGTLVYRQNFDPFGNLIGSEGDGGSSYGYAGEWTDSTGLQHLRARYYAPQQGRFTSTDPFPGMMTQPATLNPYSYVINNPVHLTDPSGEIAPILAAMLISGAVSGGIDIISQLAQNSWNIHCVSWGRFAGAVGAGAIGGLIGFYAPAASAGITGLVKLMMLGGVGGAASEIGGRAVMTAVSGDLSNWQENIFSFKRVVTDFAFGAAGGAIGYGGKKIAQGIVNPIRTRPNFYGTPNGELIPSTKQGIKNNLELLKQNNSKYEGIDSYGPFRIRLDLGGHPPTPGFTGVPDPLHEIPHIHIERKQRIISGQWFSTIKLPWDLFK